MANPRQGHFPYQNTGAKGWAGTSPVGSCTANGYGLVDVTGNVWELTVEPWSASHKPPTARCCAPVSPVATEGPRRVLKGGSHLCSPEYCLRYRPAARSPESEDSSTTHIGFRCIRRQRITDTSSRLTTHLTSRADRVVRISANPLKGSQMLQTESSAVCSLRAAEGFRSEAIE
jgi:hypothetical protein